MSYTDSKPKFYCEQCEIDCLFNCRWEIHIKTKKHINRDVNKNKICTLCEFHTTDTSRFKIHMTNTLHTKLINMHPHHCEKIPIKIIGITALMNKMNGGRATILHTLIKLNNKYNFYTINGNHLYLYHTEWLKYDIDEAKVLYDYWHDYLLGLNILTPSNKLKFNYIIKKNPYTLSELKQLMLSEQHVI